jgi:TRAP-type uncharacterized transport system substrate-binding protein
MNSLVTREGVSDDLAYRMTKLLFDHLDLLAETHPQPRISMPPRRRSVCRSRSIPARNGIIAKSAW